MNAKPHASAAQANLALPRPTDLLFMVSIVELFIGGGGRLTELGPLPLRMILFAICLMVSVLLAVLRPHRLKQQALPLLLVAVYLLVHLPALIHGLMLGNDPPTIMTELQQSLFWLIAPFFAHVLCTPAMVVRAALLTLASSIFLAVAYLLMLLAQLTVIPDPVNFYLMTLGGSPEFALRGGGLFFYKGFLYLGIGLVFLVTLRLRHWRLLAALVCIALALTLTRGFILSTGIAVGLALASQRRWKPLLLALGMFSIVAFVFLIYLPSVDEDIAGQRERSNATRLEDMAFMLDNTTVQTVLVGEGFGSPVNERAMIENTFMWAFWRMGLAGVAFWLMPLVLCGIYFGRVRRNDQQHALASSFFHSTVLIYIQTITNPYLNNPIGLSFVIVSIFALRTLSQRPSSISISLTSPRSRTAMIITTQQVGSP